MQAISIRLVLVWFVVSIALLVGGGQLAADGAKNGSTPLEVSIEEVSRNKPDRTWVKVTGGMLVVPLTTWMEDQKTHRIDELFIPVIAASEAAGDEDKLRVHVLLRTRRPDLIQRVKEMRNLDKASDQMAAIYVKKNAEKLFLQEDVKGLIEWGMNSSAETRRAIANIDKNLAGDFMIIRDGHEPQGGSGVALVGLGLMMLVGGGAFLFLPMIKKNAGGALLRGDRRPKTARRTRSRSRAGDDEDSDEVVETVPIEEPRMIDVGSDFARELGLENAPPAREKTPAVPVKPATKPVTKPVTKKVVKVEKVARVAVEEKPKAKTKPLLARKKRAL